MKKKKKILITIVVILASISACILAYNFIINPYDEYGNRCKTFYNQNNYKSLVGLEMDIPDNSCFVNECCSNVAFFRSKEKMDDLQKEVNNLKEKLELLYPEYKFHTNVREDKLYRTYWIEYYPR